MTEIEHVIEARRTTTAQVLYILHALAPFTLWTLAVVAMIVGAFTRDSVRGT